ncbi:U-box domain-containing protein 9-like [Punica granatum]|uniref:RING-type E3 ubiquitin transferase n=2 Tax=Punica granatum TaxID=22663 RepID=A0A218W3K4_PUNGR|nr:U-box domain-containing protein 9-like [Punica granatum]XP_031398092.1 U-box domain-containing protein 9-like [Punica granatum]OWM67355.1 hypothetical protein CDL15_Pgr000807 [Punica granatum]PKI43043.1 hypothetical protein CRG98_036522 [Punica granatum]
MALTGGVPELSRELSRLAAEIVGEEDCGVDVIDDAVGILCALRGLVSAQDEKPPPSELLDEAAVPEEFLCPISKRLMQEPVVLETGQTYDRSHIEELLNKGDKRCPQTQKSLSHTVLTPNSLIQELICQWCTERGIEPPKALQDTVDKAVIDPNRECFELLLNKFSTSSSFEDRKAAAKELQQLTKRVPSFRAFFTGSSSTITALLNAATHPELQEDLTATVFNLSVHKENGKVVGKDPSIISLLIELMKNGSIKSRSNAAAALFTLLADDSSKCLIGRMGALSPLIHLLKEVEPLALNDVVSAISSLCSIVENKERAVNEGVVGVILSKIKSCGPSAELISLLASFATDQDAVDQMGELRAVSCLLGILKEIPNEHSKEHCVAILYLIATRDSSKLREIRRDEKSNGTLSALARSQTSTMRAKRKANSILDKIQRMYLEMHTS